MWVLLRLVSAAALVFLLSRASKPLAAHELTVDQVHLWQTEAGRALRGQVSFDPELTRKPGAALAVAESGRRIADFLRQNLIVKFDGELVSPAYEVRELWMQGGAVPGDIVMMTCAVPAAAGTLSIAAGAGFDSLLVTVDFETVPALPPAGLLLASGEGVELQLPRQSVVRAPQSPKALARPLSASDVWLTFSRFVRLGFTHILPAGLDHVLFVCGLVLGSRGRLRRLLLEVGAFTVAHTFTLALGALGLVVLSPRLVEPLIALSIAFVALENAGRPQPSRARPWLVLSFGLLHGLGFAGSLGQGSLPETSFVLALFGFNIGVELGQLVVVAVLALALATLRDPNQRERWVVRPASLLIAMVGLYWAAERLLPS